MGNHFAIAPALGVDALRKLETCWCLFCEQQTTWFVVRRSPPLTESEEYRCDVCGLSMGFQFGGIAAGAATRNNPKLRAWGLQQQVILAESYERRLELLKRMMDDASEVVRGAVINAASAGALTAKESWWAAHRGADDTHAAVVEAARTYLGRLHATQQSLSSSVPRGIRYEAAAYQLTPTTVTRSCLYDDIIGHDNPGDAMLSVLAAVAMSNDRWWFSRLIDVVPKTDAAVESARPVLVALAGGTMELLDQRLCLRLDNRLLSVESHVATLHVIGVVGGRGCLETLRRYAAGPLRPHLASETLEKVKERLKRYVGGMSIGESDLGGLVVVEEE